GEWYVELVFPLSLKRGRLDKDVSLIGHAEDFFYVHDAGVIKLDPSVGNWADLTSHVLNEQANPTYTKSRVSDDHFNSQSLLFPLILRDFHTADALTYTSDTIYSSHVGVASWLKKMKWLSRTMAYFITGNDLISGVPHRLWREVNLVSKLSSFPAMKHLDVACDTENMGSSNRLAISSLNCPPFIAVELCREHSLSLYNQMTTT
ncbi:hypothetical protein M8C21_022238, partial [Ambrosia artemisiifolia]